MTSNEIGGIMFVGAFFVGAFMMAVTGAYSERTFGGLLLQRWIEKADEPDEYWLAHVTWIVCAIGFGAFTFWLWMKAL